MNKQWHPLFAHLLRLLLEQFYEVKTEVPVSELPRRSDLLLIRRQSREVPPFVGLWSHLTDWNVGEFKGPSDDAHPDDLELLLHVGMGLTYRFNEERVALGQERLSNRQVSFWYLAPKLGDTFLAQTQLRTFLEYQTGGLWRATVWGHPLWLVSYQDVPVEEDTIPLRLLDRESETPRALGELVLQREELLRQFASWLFTLQPKLWEEIRAMATSATDGPRINWEIVGKYTNLDEVVRVLPPEHVIQLLGVERAVQLIGMPRFLELFGLKSIVETIRSHKMLEELLAHLSPEEIQETLRRREQQG